MARSRPAPMRFTLASVFRLKTRRSSSRLRRKSGWMFIGPSAESIELFGDKVSAKNLVRKKINGPLDSRVTLKKTRGLPALEEPRQGKSVIPVIVKATAGGGGRGPKSRTRRGRACKPRWSPHSEKPRGPLVPRKFFFEKYLDSAKHIEVQNFFRRRVGRRFIISSSANAPCSGGIKKLLKKRAPQKFSS